MSGFRQIMKGGFQPTSDPLPCKSGIKIGILSGLGGEIFTYHFFHSAAASSYLEFVEQMRGKAALQTTFSISRNYRNFTQKSSLKI